MPNKSRTQTVNKGAGKMRYTGYQVDKDGTEWVSQRDSANREWLTNQKTGETELSKASQEVAAARAVGRAVPAPANAVVRAKRDFPDQDFAPSPDEGYRGEKKRGTKPDFPDQNLAPSPDEGYRGGAGNSMVAPNDFRKLPMGESSPQKKAAGGAIKKYARGGGIEQRGKTRGKFV